jgi:hypothetical protein
VFQNNMFSAISIAVNGRVQRQFAGGMFPTQAVVRTASGNHCRMPMVPPGTHDVRFLFDHVGPQEIVITCWSYVSGRPAERFGRRIVRVTAPTTFEPNAITTMGDNLCSR